VNSEHLSHIVRQPDSITGQDALELEELCRKFPAFPAPFILLARYYQQKGDYRAEETIQKAALRVHNRAWLSDFVLNKNADQQTVKETEYPQEPATVTEEFAVEEKPAVEPKAETPVEITTETHKIVEEEAVAVSEILEETVSTEDALTPQTEIAENTKTETEIFVTADITETAFEETELVTVSTLFTPEDPEEWVFDEIETLETGTEASILGFTGTATTVFTTESILFPEEMPAVGGLIQPFEESDEETSETKVDATTSIPTFINPVAPYQIEQYYPGIRNDNEEPPTDFYSWLNNPAGAYDTNQEETDAIESQKAENNRIQQQSIIDKFIQSDPGVIRPKKEFFTPETAAKKSEHLPEHLATETLAKVYLQQGNTEGAIRIYERLMLKFPEKNAYFADLIQNLKKENNP
jgi:tetratricopeptide (TPR) repeat protein